MLSESIFRTLFQLAVGTIAGVRFALQLEQHQLSLLDLGTRPAAIKAAVTEFGCALIVSLLCFG